MANYSKDSERQNKALKDLMSGKEYEKNIQLSDMKVKKKIVVEKPENQN